MEIEYVIFVEGNVGIYTVWENAVNPKSKLAMIKIVFISPKLMNLILYFTLNF